MTDARSELAEFLAERSGEVRLLPSDADLFARLGIEGDDAFEFMDHFGRHFGVDTKNYRWYFHHGEEGHSFGGIFFRPPYRRVKRIPLTSDALLEAIRTRRWPLHYPAHHLPKVRWDIRMNQALFTVAPLGLLAFWLWIRFVR